MAKDCKESENLCFNCRKPGHVARDCPEQRRGYHVAMTAWSSRSGKQSTHYHGVAVALPPPPALNDDEYQDEAPPSYHQHPGTYNDITTTHHVHTPTDSQHLSVLPSQATSSHQPLPPPHPTVTEQQPRATWPQSTSLTSSDNPLPNHLLRSSARNNRNKSGKPSSTPARSQSTAGRLPRLPSRKKLSTCWGFGIVSLQRQDSAEQSPSR